MLFRSDEAKIAKEVIRFNKDSTIEIGKIEDGKFKAVEKKKVYRDNRQKSEFVILNEDGSIDEKVSYKFITANKIIATEKEKKENVVYLYGYSVNKKTKTIVLKLIGIWRMSDESLEKAKLSKEGLKFGENGIVKLGTIKNESFTSEDDNIKYSVDLQTKTLIVYKSSGEIDEKVAYTIVSSNIIKLQNKNGKTVYLVKFKDTRFVGEPKLIGMWRTSEKSFDDALQN